MQIERSLSALDGSDAMAVATQQPCDVLARDPVVVDYEDPRRARIWVHAPRVARVTTNGNVLGADAVEAA